MSEQIVSKPIYINTFNYNKAFSMEEIQNLFDEVKRVNPDYLFYRVFFDTSDEKYIRFIIHGYKNENEV